MFSLIWYCLFILLIAKIITFFEIAKNHFYIFRIIRELLLQTTAFCNNITIEKWWLMIDLLLYEMKEKRLIIPITY
jgi:hypothetical protein